MLWREEVARLEEKVAEAVKEKRQD